MFGAGAGLLKLHDDVQTCEYEDVQVMWEMLQRTESDGSTIVKLQNPITLNQQRSTLMLYH